MSTAKETKNHEAIKKWAEQHKGVPAIIDTHQNKKGDGILRIKFDDDNENLKEISWEDFFDKFEEHNLTFLYQDEKNSRFNKFVYEEEETHSSKK